MENGCAYSKTKSNHVLSAESGDGGDSEHEKIGTDGIEESCTGGSSSSNGTYCVMQDGDGKAMSLRRRDLE